MTKMKKTAMTIAVVYILLWSVASVLAYKPAVATKTQDGIETQLFLEKTEYGKDETVEVGLRVRNTNSINVSNVKVDLVLPRGFVTHDEMTLQKTVLYAGEDIGTSLQMEKNGNPLTGDAIPILFDVIMILVSGALLIFLFVNKKIRKKSISVLLCITLLIPVMKPFTVSASEISDHAYSLGGTFRMGTGIHEIQAKISYGELMDDGIVLSSISPSTGSFGSALVLSGNGFTDTTDVVFKSDALGEISVTPTRDENGNLCVISPTIYVETVKVYAVQDGIYSNALDFHVVALPAAEGDEFEAFYDAFNRVFGEFGNELENVYQTSDTAQNLNEQQDMIAQLRAAMDEDMDYYNSLLSDEDKAIINQMFATEAFKEAIEKLNQAAEKLSHSTTSEALDNIQKTKEMIDELISALKEIKEVVNAIKIAAVAVTAALVVVSVFTGGAAAEAAAQAAKIANNCRKIISNLLNPAIMGLTAIRSLLQLAPTVSVGDSLTTADYENDISINQYFGSLESGVKDPIKALASYTSTFSTLRDNAEQASDSLMDIDALIDQFAGTGPSSGEEEITQNYVQKFNRFIWDETLETLSENGIETSNVSQLPENPLSLSLQDYVKTYMPETYFACIQKDKERHEFEAQNGLVFISLFGNSARVREDVSETPSDYTVASDDRTAEEYEFYWSFNAVLFAIDYWPYLPDSDTSMAKENIIREAAFSEIAYAKQISESLDTLREFWNTIGDIGLYAAGAPQTVRFTADQLSALSSLPGIASNLEALKDETAAEKAAGFITEYDTASGVSDEVDEMIQSILQPYSSLSIIQNTANLKTFDKFLESGFADIKADDAEGRLLMEISSILNSCYEEYWDIRTLYNLTNTDFHEFIDFISPMSDDEILALIQRSEKANEPLTAYVGEPYSFKAHMDYTTPENANIDIILDNIWDELAEIAVSEISDYLPEELDIGANVMGYITDKIVSKVMRVIVDETLGDWSEDALKKYIKLNNVYVDIVLDSDNEDVIPDSSGSRVTLSPLKPGTATIKIYPAGITDPEILKVCTIERQIHVVSGDLDAAPYDEGAKITDILDEDGNPTDSVYIGSNVQMKGEGFSLYPSDSTKQKLYYTMPYSGYTDFQKWMMGESDYHTVRFEVPDAMPGPVGVLVKGTDAGKWWQSNSLLDVLAPSLSTRLSSAFAGEGLTVNGNGFSHTPQNDKVFINNVSIPVRDLSDGFSVPAILEDVTVNKYNHGGYTAEGEEGGSTEQEGYGRLHENLNIIIPENSARSDDAEMKVSLFNDQLDSNTNTLAIKKFYEKATLSQTGFDARRPDLAVNPATGDSVMVWVRTGNGSAPSIYSSKISKSGGTLIGENKISEDVGGIDTAPINPKIVFANQYYYCIWSDKACDIVFSCSSDGVSWSTPQKIELSAAIDKNIAAAATDVDGDGDEDLLITYTAQGLTETDSSSVRMAYVNTVSDSQYFVVFAKTIGTGDNDYSAITAKDGFIAAAFSTSDKQTRTGSLYYYCGRIGAFVNSGDISWQRVMDNSGSPCTYAEHPDLAMTVSGAVANVYIVWENVNESGKEDVYFSAYTNNVQVIRPKNLTSSAKQSQSPQIFVDGSGVLGIIFIETGYGSSVNTSQEGFSSDVYMTRSFDGGQNFNMPFMKLRSAVDGERLALPSVAAYGNADIVIAWQRSNIYQEIGTAGFDQACKIDLLASDRILSDTTFAYNGEFTVSSNEYLVRSYSADIPDSIADMLYPENVKNGDLFVSMLDGSFLYQLTRRGQVAGIAEAAINGRGLVYGLGDSVVVSEADGQNPIVIYQTTGMEVAGAKWNASFAHRNTVSGDNTKLHVLLTGEKTDGKASEMIATIRFDGAVLAETDAESYYSTGFRWRDKLQSGFNTGTYGTTYYNALVRWQTFDFGMNAASKATFVEYSNYSPYDSAFKEIYAYTRGGTIKVALRDSTASYSAQAPVTVATNGIMPAIAPNDNRLLYISKSDDSVQYIENTAAEQAVSQKISSDGASYAYPQFSSSVEWVIAQEMKAESGMRIAVISPETGEEYRIGPESGVSGYASTFRTGNTKITETLNHSSVTEDGSAVPLTVRLAAANSQPVTVSVRSDDERIVITPSQITLNAGETLASFEVSAADDMLEQGDVSAAIIISTAGGSRSYNGASISRVLTIIDEDSLDVSAPVWPDDTKAGVQIRSDNSLDYTLNWTPADDNGRPIKYYIIKQGDEELGRTNTTQFFYQMPDDPGAAHLEIFGVDCGNNLTEALAVDIDSSDHTSPLIESIAVTVRGADFAEITLRADDNVQVSMIRVFDGDTLLFETLKTIAINSEILIINGLTANTEYNLNVVVYDTNSTPSSHLVSFKTKYGYTAVAFETPAAMLNEGSTQTVALIRSGDLDVNTEVPLIFEDITSTRYVDYSFDAGSINFQPGEERAELTLTAAAPYDDSISETTESFKIKFGTMENATPASENTECTVSIIDDELPVNKVEMASSQYSISEDGSYVDVIVRHVSNSVVGGFSVGYKFSDGTASNGTDYTGTPGTLVFAPGESEKTIRIPILNDGVYESDYETFTVYLKGISSANGVILGTQISSTVKINEVTSEVTVPVLTVVDDNTQWPSITVSNILGGGRLKVYRYNDDTKQYDNISSLNVGSYPQTSESWSIPINTTGRYAVARIDSLERESNLSQSVYVTVTINQITRPPALSATVLLAPGTQSGTISASISGLSAGMVYYYGVGYSSMQTSLVENEVYGSHTMDFSIEIPYAASVFIDNIPAQTGQYFNIAELTQGSAGMIYGYTITACTTVPVDSDTIKK